MSGAAAQVPDADEYLQTNQTLIPGDTRTIALDKSCPQKAAARALSQTSAELVEAFGTKCGKSTAAIKHLALQGWSDGAALQPPALVSPFFRNALR